MGFLAALVSLTQPIIARALLALGFSVVTIQGVDIVITTLKTQIITSLSAGPAAGIQLAGLSGVWVALGWLFGGITFAVSMWTLTQARRVLGVA